MAPGRLKDADPEDEDILVRIGEDLPEDTWIEVKSATTDEVRMTTCQAEAAAGRVLTHVGPCYLCVVDFRDVAVSRDELIEKVLAAGEDAVARTRCAEELAYSVAAAMHLSKVGEAIERRLSDLVVLATDTDQSGVTVEPGIAPRFVINKSLWAGEASQTIDAWVADQPLVAAFGDVQRRIANLNAEVAPKGGEDGQR